MEALGGKQQGNWIKWCFYANELARRAYNMAAATYVYIYIYLVIYGQRKAINVISISYCCCWRCF